MSDEPDAKYCIRHLEVNWLSFQHTCYLSHITIQVAVNHHHLKSILVIPISSTMHSLVRAECVRLRNEVAIKIIASYNRVRRHIAALLLPYNRAPHAI